MKRLRALRAAAVALMLAGASPSFALNTAVIIASAWWTFFPPGA